MIHFLQLLFQQMLQAWKWFSHALIWFHLFLSQKSRWNKRRKTQYQHRSTPFTKDSLWIMCAVLSGVWGSSIVLSTRSLLSRNYKQSLHFLELIQASTQNAHRHARSHTWWHVHSVKNQGLSHFTVQFQN